MADNDRGKGNGAKGDSNKKAAGENEGLTTHDLNELNKFSELMISREAATRREGDRVNEMWGSGHWWDCKVPESERWFLNFVSLKTCTDKGEMSRCIRTYEKFYQEMNGAVNELRKAARKGTVDADETLKLYEKLSQMLEKAEHGKNTTNSSTLYEVHETFIALQGRIENMIRRVECVALRQELRQVKRAWKEALTEIRRMSEEMQGLREDNSEIRQRLEDLAATNEQMAQNQQILMQQNEIMTNMLSDILRRP